MANRFLEKAEEWESFSHQIKILIWLEEMLMKLLVKLELVQIKSILSKYKEKNTYFLCFCSLFLWILYEHVLSFSMIENYKGWDITLNLSLIHI